MILWSYNYFLSRNVVPSRNALLQTSKLRLLQLTRYCSNSIEVRWAKLRSIMSRFFVILRAKNY